MFEYNYTKTAYLAQLQIEINGSTLATKYNHLETLGTALTVTFSSELTTEEIATLDAIVAAHTGATTVQQLSAYLDNAVFPFVVNLIRTFAAENISMGITQAGKSGETLGLFEKQFVISGTTRAVSLKSAFDTGSLYVARGILQHVRTNSSEYDGLSPFVTDARLLAMINKIETFLGLALST